tara:strand:+ start:96677 stop:98125 length:1449 start_codon:yes stop_codon:yes gene_type:complete
VKDVDENGGMTMQRLFAKLGLGESSQERNRAQAAARKLVAAAVFETDAPQAGNDTMQADRWVSQPKAALQSLLNEPDLVTPPPLDVIQQKYGCFTEIFDSAGYHESGALRVAVKDVFAFDGHRPTAGLPSAPDWLALDPSPAIQRILSAGGRIVGTTKLSPWCYLPIEHNEFVAPPRNSAGADLLVGGSSSGSAVAVASGAVPVALGTDTGGSVRIPAALCGVLGFKPTAGRIPLEGVVPLGKTQDTIGILARKTEHLSNLFAVLANDRAKFAGQAGSDLGIAVPKAIFEHADPQIVAAAARARVQLSDAGYEVAETLPLPLGALNAVAGVITGHEAGQYHDDGLVNRPDCYAPSVRDRLLVGLSIHSSEYRKALEIRATLRHHVLSRVFGTADFVMLPTVNCFAPKVLPGDDPDPAAISALSLELLSLNRWVNLLGLPAISIPLSQPGALPTSIQIVGRPHSDERIIEIAGIFEQATASSN